MALTMVETFKLKPGRMGDARTILADMKPKLAALGASNVRVMHPEGGGALVNDLMLSWELDDWSAFASFREAFFKSPERDALVKAVDSENAPFSHVSSMFFSDVAGI